MDRSYVPGLPSSTPLPRRLLYAGLRLFYGSLRPSFSFEGKSLPYFWSPYNMTGRGERAVEIPIAMDALRTAGPRVLEVGNVLSHYFPVRHDVIDKYEPGPGVLAADIVDFQPPEPYDFIVSISTLEHVGWDETPRDPERVFRAFDNLRTRCLKPGGKALVTAPLGYNPFFDRSVGEGRFPFSRVFFFRRLSKFNRWAEADFSRVAGARYNTPFPLANALLVGFIEKGDKG